MEEEKKKNMAAKEAFFDDLYKLDRDDSEDDEGNEATLTLELPRMTNLSAITPEQRVTSEARLPTAMGRTHSSPLPLAKRLTPHLRPINLVKETSIASASAYLQGKKQSAMASKTDGLLMAGTKQSKPASKATKRKKRGKSLEPMPESQQIFKDMAFYFLPNNNISPARALRIRRAQEWGAIWIKDWKDGITHVVVDRDLHYDDVLKYLKLTAMPAHVTLVNEIYPSDCMIYRYILNPSQDRYQLNGQKKALAVTRTPTSTTSSLVSLPLKYDNTKGPPQTPSRSEGSDELSAQRHLELIAQRLAAEREEAKRTSGHVAPRDALNEAIEQAKEIEGMPLESDEEASQPELDDDSGPEGEPMRKKQKSSRKPEQASKGTWQKNFACMHKHDGLDNDDDPNIHTIQVLQKMADYYDRTQDQWRVLAYRKAIASIRKHKVRITTKAEALALPFVGVRLAAKIEEIVCTNSLRRLENATSDDPADAALQIFLKIYGVGFSQAQSWVSQGHRTLASLSASASLTANQKIGIDHFEDFLTRIPRSEVEVHAKFLRGHLAAVCPSLELTVGGSYRRGSPDSGDIDYLITSPTASLSTLRTLLIDSLIPRLFVVRYLRAALASCDPSTGTKWHGAACLPSVKAQIWRRIDFLLVPWEEMGAALIYWTGNDIFNRSMRLLASKKGMRLNQRGLFENVVRGPGRVKMNVGQLVESRSEKAIFERLGVPWRPPQHRIC